MFQSSIATYEEIMPSEIIAHTNQHQTKHQKGTIIVLYFLVLFLCWSKYSNINDMKLCPAG